MLLFSGMIIPPLALFQVFFLAIIVIACRKTDFDHLYRVRIVMHEFWSDPLYSQAYHLKIKHPCWCCSASLKYDDFLEENCLQTDPRILARTWKEVPLGQESGEEFLCRHCRRWIGREALDRMREIWRDPIHAELRGLRIERACFNCSKDLSLDDFLLTNCLDTDLGTLARMWDLKTRGVSIEFLCCKCHEVEKRSRIKQGLEEGEEGKGRNSNNTRRR